MIEAELVQASRFNGKVVWTFNITYGLIVHAELLRHKLLSHSVKSNRAIEPHRIRKEVIKNPYVPVRFGKNQRGMVADGESKNSTIARKVWLFGRYLAVATHFVLDKLGIHKEVCNRVLNPWQHVRETLTFTEYDNLFNLRLHKDAQLDIQLLVLKIKRAMETAEANHQILDLNEGDAHVPYVTRVVDNTGKIHYQDNDGTELNLSQATICSVARCARSSYDNHDGSTALYNKRLKPYMRTDLELYTDLMVKRPLHASPAEHVAYPMVIKNHLAWFDTIGVTHQTSDGSYWSGNLKGWIQDRHVFKNESCWNYVKTDSHIE